MTPQDQQLDFESMTEEQQLAIINGPDFNGNISDPEEEGDAADNTESLDEENAQENDEWEAEDEAQPQPEETDPKDKKKSGVAKVIEQRNEARAERDQLATELAQAKARIRELTTQDVRTQDEDLELIKLTTKETILDRDIKNAEEAEKRSFYKSFPDAEKDKAWIEAVLEKYPDMSYKQAYQFYLVEQGRAAELAKDVKQPKTNKYWVAWGTPQAPWAGGEMTTAEYEKVMKDKAAKGQKTPFY